MLSRKTEFLKVPVIPDERGNLSFLQSPDHIPFDIKSVYWINNIHGTISGNEFANTQTNEIIIALSGSFDVVVYEGAEEKRYRLSRPDTYLSVPSMTWRKLENFATNSVALVAVDRHDNENEKITDLAAYKMSSQYA